MFKYNKNVIYFLHFIVERQNIFIKKSRGGDLPFSNDKVLATHKFTNVYRFLDYESQFLIREVIGDDNRSYEDTVFRVLLFKMINLSSTWEYLESKLGEISYSTPIEDIDTALDLYRDAGNKIFSSAYLQASNFVQRPEYKYLQGMHKHHQYLTVFNKELFNSTMIASLGEQRTLKELCLLLQTVNGIGGFMSYQFAQDLNYTKYFNHDMDSFTIEGPGSIRGVNRCFDGISKDEHADVIKWTYDNLDMLFDECGMVGEFQDFNGHKLQLPDIQNCFCEADKYMRGMGVIVDGVTGKAIKQKYNPSKRRKVDKYVAPVKWGIPDLICK